MEGVGSDRQARAAGSSGPTCPHTPGSLRAPEQWAGARSVPGSRPQPPCARDAAAGRVPVTPASALLECLHRPGAWESGLVPGGHSCRFPVSLLERGPAATLHWRGSAPSSPHPPSHRLSGSSVLSAHPSAEGRGAPRGQLEVSAGAWSCWAGAQGLLPSECPTCMSAAWLPHSHTFTELLLCVVCGEVA